MYEYYFICYRLFWKPLSTHSDRYVPVADQLRAKIYFVHVEHVPATDIQASGGMLEQVMQHRRQAAMEGLNKMKWETAEFAFNNNTHIESDHILTTGMIVEEIIHAADSIQPQFVVLGVPTISSSFWRFSSRYIDQKMLLAVVAFSSCDNQIPCR